MFRIDVGWRSDAGGGGIHHAQRCRQGRRGLMRRKRLSTRRITMFRVLLILLALLPAAASAARGQTVDAPVAPELTGLGTLHVPVTTPVSRAQRFFDQGMRLLYAFNHAEAIRAFR